MAMFWVEFTRRLQKSASDVTHQLHEPGVPRLRRCGLRRHVAALKARTCPRSPKFEFVSIRVQVFFRPICPDGEFKQNYFAGWI
jgi:hypothetical protein